MKDDLHYIDKLVNNSLANHEAPPAGKDEWENIGKTIQGSGSYPVPGSSFIKTTIKTTFFNKYSIFIGGLLMGAGVIFITSKTLEKEREQMKDNIPTSVMSIDSIQSHERVSPTLETSSFPKSSSPQEKENKDITVKKREKAAIQVEHSKYKKNNEIITSKQDDNIIDREKVSTTSSDTSSAGIASSSISSKTGENGTTGSSRKSPKIIYETEYDTIKKKKIIYEYDTVKVKSKSKKNGWFNK